jgi:hypothetical protein
LHGFINTLYLCIIFYIAIVPYIAIVGDLAPQVESLSSLKMTPLSPTQHPCSRDLMISIKVIGKLCSGAKNSRMGKLSEKFRKWFQKSWSSIYSTEVFSKWFWTNKVGYGRKGVGGFIKVALFISVRQTN